MGEVNDPKLLKMDRAGMSLTEALSNVGGINQLSADATGVFVIRKSQDNQSLGDIYQLDISDAAALVIGTEFDLEPYDIVYVTAAPVPEPDQQQQWREYGVPGRIAILTTIH